MTFKLKSLAVMFGGMRWFKLRGLLGYEEQKTSLAAWHGSTENNK